MKPTNSPTQGQPNPRKIRLKVTFGPLFPKVNSFSWVGNGFMQETDYKKPNSTKILHKHPRVAYTVTDKDSVTVTVSVTVMVTDTVLFMCGPSVDSVSVTAMVTVTVRLQLRLLSR